MSFLGAITAAGNARTLGVVPIMVGPMAALLAALPAIALALVGLMVTLLKPSTLKRLVALLWAQKIPVAIIVVVMSGAVYAYGYFFETRGNGGEGSSGSGTWSMFRGGFDRRGWRSDGLTGSQHIEDPAHGIINWSFSDGKIKTFYSSPAVIGNRIYATGSCYEYFTDAGGIYCLDAENKGKLVWAFKGDKFRSTFSSPAVSDDKKYLVVGEGLHLTKDARIFCLDISQAEKTGVAKRLWNFRTASHVESSPCIWKDRMFIGAGEDGLFCFALEPNKDGSANKLWQRDGNDLPDCESAPMVYEGKLYFGLGRGFRSFEEKAYAERELRGVACLDPENGKTIWQVATPWPTDSPAIANGKLYIAGGWGDFVKDAPAVRADLATKLKGLGKSEEEIKAALAKVSDGGHVWCIDLKTQHVDWKCDQLKQTVLGTPAVDGNFIYVGSRDGNLYCVDAKSGAVARTFNAHGAVVASPALGEKYIYFPTSTGTLYALDKTTLAPAWVLGLNQETFSSPAVTKGHVFIGTNGNGFLCVGAPGVEKAPPLWPGALGGPGKAGTLDSSAVSASSSFGWSFNGASAEDAGDDTAANTYLIQSPPAAIAGSTDAPTVFYVGVSDKSAHGVAALSTKELGTKATQQWMANSPNPVFLSPVATEKDVFFVDGRAGDKGRKLYRVDRAGGKSNAVREIADGASGEMAIGGSGLYIVDKASGLSRVELGDDADGKKSWSRDVGPCVGMPAAAGDLVAVAVQTPPHLAVLDSASGEVIWTHPLASAPLCGAVLSRDRVWVASSGGIQGYSVVNGQPTIEIRCDPIKGQIICDGYQVVCVTETGQLIAADAETGKITCQVKDAVASVPPIVANGTALYYAKDSIERLDLASGKSTVWSKVAASWPGTIVTPMIMVDSHVFFGTDKRGFICYKPKKG